MSYEFTLEDVITALINEAEPDHEHYGLPVFSIGGNEYAIAATEEEAEEAAKDCLRETLWAFSPDFLLPYTDVSHSALKALHDTSLCEDLNDIISAIVGNRLDDLLDAAIDADGLGHVLSPFNGETIELDDDIYVFRCS